MSATGSRHAVALFLLAAIASATAFATDGSILSGVGPIQMGTAGAGAAWARDQGWALSNPAGLAALDRRIDSYLMLADLHKSIEPKGLLANPFAGDETDASGGVFPGFGLVWPTEFGTLALGAHGVMGTSVDYAHPRTIIGIPGHTDRRFQYNVLHIPLTYAYEFDNGWSVGASAIGLLGRFRSDTLTTKLRPTAADYDWDHEEGIAFNIGAQKKWDRFTLSGMYMTRGWMQRFEEYQDLLKHTLDLPPEIRFGAAFEATPKLTLLLDYRFIHWEAIPIYEESNREGGVDWDNQHIVKFGAEWQASEKWAVRGGLSYGKSPIKENTTFVNSLYPAFSEWHFAVGATYQHSDRLALHAALTHSPRETFTDPGDGDIFSRLSRGSKARYGETVLTLGQTWRF